MKFFWKKKSEQKNESPEKGDPFQPYHKKKVGRVPRPPVPWAKLRGGEGGSRVLSWGTGDGRGGEIRIENHPVAFSLNPERTGIVVADGEKKHLIPAGGEASAVLLIRKIEREFRTDRISLPFKWGLFLLGAFILISLLSPTRSVGEGAIQREYAAPSGSAESPLGSVGKKLWKVPSSLLSDPDLRRSYGNIGLSCSASR